MRKLSSSTCLSILDVNTSHRISIYNRPILMNRDTNLYYGPFHLCVPTIIDNQYVDIETGELVRRTVYRSTEEYREKALDNVRRSSRRAKLAIIDIARLNSFTHFGTLTIDDKLQDSSLIKQTTENLLSALKSYQKMADGFKYIIVPEFGGEKGRLHFHFLMKGIREKDLFYNEYNKLDFHYFRDRFGFVQITPIGKSRGDIERVAIYCGKYISKDNIQIKGHRYFCSKGLLRVNKQVISSPVTAKFVIKFLENYGETCYYDGMCKAYDIPEFLYDKLQQYVLEEWMKVAFHHHHPPSKYQQYWELI